MNTVVVIENQSTKQCLEQKPHPFGSKLDVPCLCGNRIHPIVGAWCPQCGAKVVEVRNEIAYRHPEHPFVRRAL